MNSRKTFFLLILSLFIIFPAIVWAQHNHELHDHDNHEEHGGHDDHEEKGHHEEDLHVSKAMQNTIGLTIESVQLRMYEETIKVYGAIAQDTDKYTHITSNVEGVVKKVYVKTGDIIDTGEPILSVLKKSGVIETINAPHHGTVIAIHAKPDERVDNLRSLISLADLDILRVSFDVYEKDLRFVSVGQMVHVYSTAYPDRVFDGEVVFVSPRIDKDTQTIKIRAEVKNHEHLLRLGMFVTGDLFFSTEGEVLSVSRQAVQQIEDDNVVFIPDGEEFSLKKIEVGREFGAYVEIKDGLHDGDRIVSKGSFALKSELQKGAFGDGHNH